MVSFQSVCVLYDHELVSFINNRIKKWMLENKKMPINN